eukprot:TRINITY_DN930_c0_g1_i2.p1 TRINITY_DN930_c0_g1~~TRINITY_DN930_c0_g1_i2.p1  ORF type:complete len:235 (+),score=24.64 TRINITY_DN930_c0_g1_i2:95-706(+)
MAEYEGPKTHKYRVPPIDPSRNRFPFCIVWGPLPCISWFLPFVGHMGIGDSEGKIHDFAGSYYISCDDFMVGSVTKYVQLDPRRYFTASSSGVVVNPLHTNDAARHTSSDEISEEDALRWDEGIRQANDEFRQTTHNICCNNCHDHVARSLSIMGTNTSMLRALGILTLRGKYTGVRGFVSTYFGFFIIAAIILLTVLIPRYH